MLEPQRKLLRCHGGEALSPQGGSRHGEDAPVVTAGLWSGSSVAEAQRASSLHLRASPVGSRPARLSPAIGHRLPDLKQTVLNIHFVLCGHISFFYIIIFDCHFLTVSWLGCAAAALIRGCAKHNLF